MTLLEEEWPYPGEAPEPEGKRPIPWEDPDLPSLAGWWRTLKELLCSPTKFFGEMDPEGWSEALAFGLIMGTAGFLACLYWQTLLGAGLSRQVGGMPGFSQLFALGAGVTLALMLLSPIIVVANLGLSSLCLWGGVALMGGGTAFTPILRVVSYAQGGMAPALIPFLGAPVAGLWVLVLTYKGVKTALGLSGGRALGALAISLALQIMIFLFFLGCLVGLTGIWLFWG